MATTVDSPTSSPHSIAPGQIAAPAKPGGRAFLLSSAEWLTIQVFVANAVTLPTTEQTFKDMLGPKAPDDLKDFEPLIACYESLNTHCIGWRDTIYPAVVSLASDIHQYGAQKAPTFYGAILKEADALVANPADEKTKATLKAILDNLSAEATRYQAKAAGIAKQIHQFATDTENDETTLIGTDGKGGLYDKYDKEFGSESAEVKELNDDIAAQQVILDAEMKEYHDDVVIAATTPTYAWVPFVGWIAAAGVAGTYGQRAVEALRAAHAARDQITADNELLARDQRLMDAIKMAQRSLTNIAGQVGAALPAIQKVEGVWGAIASDIDAIVALIDRDIRQAIPILMSLGIDEAIQSWQSVADEADQFRVNAYVKFMGDASAAVN